MLLPPASAEGAVYFDADLLTCLFDGPGPLVDVCSSAFLDVSANAHADLLATQGIGSLGDFYAWPIRLLLVPERQAESVDLLQVPAKMPQNFPQFGVIAQEELGAREVDAERAVSPSDASDALIGE
ncbi:hypothetical protein [Streptomyces alfalfae]|uniref:Uncharacterized protein n=1 Tax=Streptomyces alfalfae TaxID=1642299 RepID=A0A7T4TYU9_9ACTN|nr:hypothetical protein [Streptomyces alfalfae]QQC90540.1 hypothetical protein I8755_20620 [Streptomyces alfalfae]